MRVVIGLDQGLMAPSSIDKFGSGITSAGSISNFVPSPSHSGQAPKGELNEKVRGSISGILMPQSGQAWCSLNIFSVPFIMTFISPLDSLSAVSTESDNRSRAPFASDIVIL